MYEILSKSTQELLKQFQKGQPSWWLFFVSKGKESPETFTVWPWQIVSRWKNSKLHHRVTVNVKLGGILLLWLRRYCCLDRGGGTAGSHLKNSAQTKTNPPKKIRRMSSTLLFSARSQYGKHSWIRRYCVMFYRKKKSPTKMVVYKKETPWLKVYLQYDVVRTLPTCSEMNSGWNENHWQLSNWVRRLCFDITMVFYWHGRAAGKVRGDGNSCRVLAEWVSLAWKNTAWINEQAHS